MTDILENYAQIVERKDPKTGRMKREQIFPRYHQLDVVRKLLDRRRTAWRGKRYLIQHSAGSGKSNSIAWLAHQLIGLAHQDTTVFDSIIVVTDRRILDQQIRDTIKQFAQVARLSAMPSIPATCAGSSRAARRSSSRRSRNFPSFSTRSGASIETPLRHHHRRGAFQPGRQGIGCGEYGPRCRWRRGGRRDDRGRDQPHHGGAQDAAERELLRLHGHAEEQDAGNLRRADRRRRGRSSTGRSTATR